MATTRGVLGLYTSEPIGADHPLHAVRTAARMRASIHAGRGLLLVDTLERVRRELTPLFGPLPQPLVDATVTTTWLEVSVQRSGRRD